MELTPVMKNQILTDWQNAPFGHKRRVLEKWAGSLGCTVKTLYLQIPRELKSQREPRKGVPKIKGIKEFSLIVAQVKRRSPRKLLATEDAVALAYENGLIPEDIAKVPVSTFNTHMRKLGMNKGSGRVVRFQADYPNQLHHIDASGSDCFFVKKNLPDGDAVLKLDHRPYKGYKNKIKDPEDGNRLWVYGLVDDHSGLMKARYVAAPGESSLDNLDFVSWVWSEIGLPEWLKADHGPMMKTLIAKEFLKNLSIDVDPSVPGKSRTHGKIERPWRTIWRRFENPFYVENHKTFEITLSELNRRFSNYLESYNNKFHRYERRVTRLNVWKRVGLRGGIVEMPENAIRTMARRFKRTVEHDGCFSLHGEVYEVKGLHRAKVWVYQGVFDDRLIVEDVATGEKYEVEVFKPLGFHEFRGQKETPDELAFKQARELKAKDKNGNERDLKNTLYMAPEDHGNVESFPVPVKEIRQVPDVLDANTYPSVEAALRDFIAISGVFLDMDIQARIREEIINNGLNKTFVRELALEVQAENERSAKHG
jgi:hypothetical protein